MTEKKYKVRVPWFQRLSVVRETLKVYEGVHREQIVELNKALQEQRGTPQNQMDWSDPNAWIDARLGGELAALARRFWEESDHRVNPRWLHGPDFLIRTYRLAELDVDGIYRLTDPGRGFISAKADTIRVIDDGEGMLEILAMLSTKSPAKFGDVIDEWTEFVRANSKFQADSSIRDALRRRLRDLVERGLVSRERSTYSITPRGMDHLGQIPEQPEQATLRSIHTFNETQRAALRERLATMDPYRFEYVIGQLLEAMGYEDVQVTRQAGDKGVDVVATVQFGITTITEVVQVKRHQGSISRQVVDQLRGALPYHRAIRGTIITTGRFSGGCKDAALFAGAAPIGLIDGEHLLDLLFEHRIGVTERPAALYRLDESYFTGPLESDSDEGDVSD